MRKKCILVYCIQDDAAGLFRAAAGLFTAAAGLFLTPDFLATGLLASSACTTCDGLGPLLSRRCVKICETDALFNIIAMRRFLNEGPYLYAVLHLYHSSHVDGRTSVNTACGMLNKPGKKLPKPLLYTTFNSQRFYRCLVLAESIFDRQPRTGYNVGNIGDRWDDRSKLPNAGTRPHRFCNFLSHVAGTLNGLQDRNFSLFEKVAHLKNILEFTADEGFVQYQIELMVMWCMRYKILRDPIQEDEKYMPRNRNLFVPTVREVAGPGMIPFAATLAPNLFDMPGSDMPPVKRMRTDDDEAGSLGSRARKHHKRHAIMVTDFLMESTPS